MKEKDDTHYFLERSALPECLRTWRNDHGLKIETAAGELGVATATWGHWETGHTFPSGEMLLNLCSLMGMPMEMLLCPHRLSCPFLPDQDLIISHDELHAEGGGIHLPNGDHGRNETLSEGGLDI